jgi:hypothetical protein
MMTMNKIVHLERIVESLLEHLEEHTYMNSVHNEIYKYNKREYEYYLKENKKEQMDEEQKKVNKILEDYENQIEREANDE